MKKAKIDYILIVVGFSIAMYIGLYISAISVGVYVVAIFIAMIICGTSCREENPIYKFLDYNVGIWIGSIVAITLLAVLLLFGHNKLYKHHVLKQPAIVDSKVCGMEHNKLVCYNVSSISDKIKYKIKKDKISVIIDGHIRYNIVDRPINTYYTIGDEQ